jgi:hypothetical protein
VVAGRVVWWPPGPRGVVSAMPLSAFPRQAGRPPRAACHADYMELLHSPPPGCTIHIVRALRSDRWTPPLVGAVRDAAAATAARPREGDGRTLLHELPDAGHWLHVDNLPGLLRLMRPYLAAEARRPRGA